MISAGPPAPTRLNAKIPKIVPSCPAMVECPRLKEQTIVREE